MSFMLTRMFAYLTLFTYLAVGVVAVRVYMPEESTVELSTSYLKYFSKTEFKSVEPEALVQPELAFSEIKFPVEKKVVRKVIAKKIASKKIIAKAPEFKHEAVSKNELPFNEPVTLKPVVMTTELETNMIALYKDIRSEMIADAVKTTEDVISTKLAADTEPEFFEYPVEEKNTDALVKEETTVAQANEDEISTIPQSEPVVENVQTVSNEAPEEIAVDDLVAFDYSNAEEKKAETSSAVIAGSLPVTTQGSSPVVPSVTTQAPKVTKSGAKPASKPVTTQASNSLMSGQMGFMQETSSTFPNRVTIQITGTDLKNTQTEVGFEVRPQDDLSETFSDYNNGSVTLEQDLSEEKMTRSVAILKRGFAPTNTDLILEEGTSEITVPLIEEDTFNEMLAPYESRGPIGAVLVELEDEVESASLDVPFSKVLMLDEKMNITTGDDFTYQLFLGVKAGNALLSYKSSNGEVTSKIIHVHEHELTFETNFFEEVTNEKVTLLEEDLLSKDKNPLIISSEVVRQFATEKTARKINDHTMKTDFRKTLLGGRKYLELNHQDEPVFVGYKSATTLEIPSENFMRYILSKFEGGKLGNRCLVQVNLNKKAVRVDIGPESVGESLMTYTQVLDADGKFYDSVGEKSQKIIVVGENQGSSEYTMDSRINFKITFQDGSVQYLGSYCSPNTYLVEQL